MGKKSKKSDNKKSRSRAKSVDHSGSNTTTQKPNPININGKAATETNRGSLYSIYKYCTQTVIDWGKAAYGKLEKTQRHDKVNDESSLSQLIFQCLGSVAVAHTAMPPHVLGALRTAISYRKRVHAYYYHGTNQDHSSHKWLILQLERLEEAFSSLEQEQQKGDALPNSKDFKVLSLEEDQELDEPDKANDASASVQPREETRSVPTKKDLEQEERQFAVALTLSEIGAVREKLRNLWGDWSAKKNDEQKNNEQVDAAELLAVTSCTEYLLTAMKKLVLQTSLEFGAGDIFDQILRTYCHNAILGEGGIEVEPPTEEKITKGEWVTLRKLQAKPELNGRHGRIVKPMENGRVGVQLFPEPGDATVFKEDKQLAIKPDNLLLSDNTCFRLSQIYHVVTKDFSFKSIPSPPSGQYGSQQSPQVLKSRALLQSHLDLFNDSLENRDFMGLLHWTVKILLPMWMSYMARYRRDERDAFEGDFNLVLMSFLHDFDESRRVDFSLSLALLVSMDCAFAASKVSEFGRGERAFEAGQLSSRVLHEAFVHNVYEGAAKLFQQDNFQFELFLNHMDTMRHADTEYAAMKSFIPWISGALLLDGLRYHLFSGTALVLHYVQTLTTQLHLYWMLRSEGYLGIIQEIERTLIAMDPQRAFFRGGVPQRGQRSYLKLYQLGLGTFNARSVQLLNGRAPSRMFRRRAEDQSHTGFYPSEISELRNILQWKSEPISDIDQCCEKLQKVARTEFFSLFTQPLMSLCLKLLRMRDPLSSLARVADQSKHDFVLQTGASDHAKVCHWAISLADKGEKEEKSALRFVAKHFQDAFQVEVRTENEEVQPLAFGETYLDIDTSRLKGASRSGGAK